MFSYMRLMRSSINTIHAIHCCSTHQKVYSVLGNRYMCSIQHITTKLSSIGWQMMLFEWARAQLRSTFSCRKLMCVVFFLLQFLNIFHYSFFLSIECKVIQQFTFYIYISVDCIWFKINKWRRSASASATVTVSWWVEEKVWFWKARIIENTMVLLQQMTTISFPWMLFLRSSSLFSLNRRYINAKMENQLKVFTSIDVVATAIMRKWYVFLYERKYKKSNEIF